MHVNFITLKWGSKYGPEYVNRLYKCLEKIYSGPFTFYCFTDNKKDILPNIVVRDINTLRQTKIVPFTNEKIYLFETMVGNNVLLDLDILIIKDLYPYLSDYNFTEPRFILNYWSDKFYSELLSRYGRNYINSSFVTWKDNQLKFIIDFYNENKKVIDFKYGDLDAWLFNGLRDKLNYHPENLIMSFNSTPDNTYDTLSKSSIILFNTSHGTGRGKELHQGPDWAISHWKSFD